MQTELSHKTKYRIKRSKTMTISKLFFAAVTLLFASGLTAQQRVPDFKGTTICLNFGGQSAIDTQTTFVKMGVAPESFVDRNGDCRNAPVPHIRISVQTHDMESSNESSSVSGNGRGYSSYGSGSRSGKWIAADAMATLVRSDGDYVRIGFNSEALQSGSLSNSNSNSGARYSNSSSFSRTTPDDEVAGTVMKHSLHTLLSSKKHWVPNANMLISEVFGERPPAATTRKSSETSAPTATKTNPTGVDLTNARADDLIKQTKQIKADIKAAKTAAEAEKKAKTRLAKADAELQKALKEKGIAAEKK
jgi:hypothetical protein